MELPAELALERPARVGEVRLQPRRGGEGRPDVQELLGIEPAAARRALDCRADVTGAGDADPGPLLDQRPGLVRLVQAARHEDGVRFGHERLGETAARTERGPLRQPGADVRELQDLDGAWIHGQRVERARLSASRNRHGRLRHGCAA